MRGLFKLSFNQLVLSNVFLGARKESFSAIMKPFILGYRGPYCILNVSFVFSQFKLVLHMLVNISFRRKKILFI